MGLSLSCEHDLLVVRDVKSCCTKDIGHEAVVPHTSRVDKLSILPGLLESGIHGAAKAARRWHPCFCEKVLLQLSMVPLRRSTLKKFSRISSERDVLEHRHPHMSYIRYCFFTD